MRLYKVHMRLTFRSNYFNGFIFLWFRKAIFILPAWNYSVFLFITFMTFLKKFILSFLNLSRKFWRRSFLFKHFTDDLCVFRLKIVKFFLLSIFYSEYFVVVFNVFLKFMMLWFAWKHFFWVKRISFCKNSLLLKIYSFRLIKIVLLLLLLVFILFIFRIISIKKILENKLTFLSFWIRF